MHPLAVTLLWKLVRLRIPAPSKALISREPPQQLLEEFPSSSNAPGSVLPPSTAFWIPKLAHQSCWSLAPSHSVRVGKNGERGKGCHCCWFHMAQLAQAGSGFGCLMGIPCQSFPFQRHSVHQHSHAAANVVSKQSSTKLLSC